MIQQPRKSGYLARKYTDRDIDGFFDLDDKETDRLRKKGVLQGKIKGLSIMSPGEFLLTRRG